MRKPAVNPGKWGLLAAPLLVFALAGMLCSSLAQTSVTADEFSHLPAGLIYWETGSFWAYRESPPLPRLIAALPLRLRGIGSGRPRTGAGRLELGRVFMRENWDDYHALFLSARGMIVALSCLCALLLFWAAYRALGVWPAVVATTLFCFSPTVLAHGGLVTSDAAFCLAFLGVCVLAARFFQRPTPGRTAALGAALGFALLTKFTAPLIYPLLLAAAAFLLAAKTRGPALGFARLPFRRQALLLGAAFLLSLFILNAGYLFQGSGAPLRGLPLEHSGLAALAASPLGLLPCPVPGDYILGLDVLLAEVAKGLGVYLLGRLSETGWWYYYPLALPLKLPVPLFMLLAAAAAALWRGELARRPLLLACLGGPVLVLVVVALFTRVELGVRYLLFLLPPLYLAAAHLASGRLWTRPMQAFLAVCLVWYCASSLLSRPHYIAYFSELAGGSGSGHRLLADSNLDWGQDLVRLERFMRRRGIDSVALSHFGPVDPSVYGIRWEPLTREPTRLPVVVSVNHLLGIHPYRLAPPVERFRGREPLEKIGPALWLFEDRAPPAEGVHPEDDGRRSVGLLERPSDIGREPERDLVADMDDDDLRVRGLLVDGAGEEQSAMDQPDAKSGDRGGLESHESLAFL